MWAKFNRRPWWPCHICDSDQGTHTKMKGECSFITQYQVNYVVVIYYSSSDGDISGYFASDPSPRPCRVYFLETIGEILERAWVPENAILPFKGGHEFKDLPVLRRRGKQKEKDYKYTVY